MTMPNVPNVPKIKSDLTGWVMIATAVVGIIWWCADTNARLKTVETATLPIAHIQSDVSSLKTSVADIKTMIANEHDKTTAFNKP